VGEVLSAYEKISVKVRKSIVVEEPEPPVIEISDDEILDYVTEYWNTSTRRNYVLLNEKAFDILWKRKLINPTNLDKVTAEAIKNKIIGILSASDSKLDKENLKKDHFIKTQCKKYALMLYLNGEL
jgi:hypothetical protein